VFSACVAAVKCRPVLHHCVVIFSGPSNHRVYMCVVCIWKWSSTHALGGVSGVASFITAIWKWSSAHALGGVCGVASFITADEQLQWNRGCCFLMQALLPEGFPFHQLNDSSTCSMMTQGTTSMSTTSTHWRRRHDRRSRRGCGTRAPRCRSKSASCSDVSCKQMARNVSTTYLLRHLKWCLVWKKAGIYVLS